MKNFLLLCLGLTFVVQQVFGNEACEPGTAFIADDGCNRCHCPSNGLKTDAACTRMACIAHCIPGVSFKSDDGCNTCSCPPSGLKSEAACTLKLCLDANAPKIDS